MLVCLVFVYVLRWCLGFCILIVLWNCVFDCWVLLFVCFAGGFVY